MLVGIAGIALGLLAFGASFLTAFIAAIYGLVGLALLVRGRQRIASWLRLPSTPTASAVVAASSPFNVKG